MRKLLIPLFLLFLSSSTTNINNKNINELKLNWDLSNIDQQELQLDYEVNYLLSNKPWLSLWNSVFNESEDYVLFFNRTSNDLISGQLIDKVKKNDFIVNNDLLKEYAFNLRGNWNQKANQVSTRANNSNKDITWNSGRKESFRKSFEEYKEVIPLLADIYESHKLPRSLVSHLVAESFLNPNANSGQATGLAQISNNNNRFFRNFLRRELGVNYDHKDFVTQVGLSAAMVNIAVKRNDNSFITALTDYHAGILNTERLKTIGSVELSNYFEKSSDLENYVEGLLIAHNSRNHPAYRRVFFSAGMQTRNYSGIVASFIPMVREEDSICKETINRYILTANIENVILRSGMSENDFKKYNPHINLRQKELVNTPVNLFSELDIYGKDNFWEKDSNVWGEWEKFNINNTDSLNYFKNKFLDEGIWTMGAAIELYSQTLGAFNNNKINRVSIPVYLDNLRNTAPWRDLAN